jgi:4'-phosphopantetheinyl transferase EntD
MLDWLLGPKTETVSKADYDALKANYDAQLVVLRNSFAEVEQLRLNLKGADATATRYRQMYTAAQAERDAARQALTEIARAAVPGGGLQASSPPADVVGAFAH